VAEKGLGVALGSLLACEVDVIATHATLRGLEPEKRDVEGTGEFNYGRYAVRINSEESLQGADPGPCETLGDGLSRGDTQPRSVSMTLKAIIE